MLDFLVEENLAHKLDSTHQYLACSHIICEHEHSAVQFLIGDKCHMVDEILIHDDIMHALSHSAKNKGFSLRQEPLELHGICNRCS